MFNSRVGVDELTEVRRSLARFGAGFDPRLITATAAAQVMTEAAAIENMAATIKAMAGARVADTELWRRDGHRSPAHHLAKASGTSVSAADEALRTGRRLQDQDTARSAATAGDLSAAQAAAVTDAVAADPGAEQRLVDQAKDASLGELRDECRRTKAAATSDAAARHAAIHRSRHLRHYTDAEGAFNLHLRHTADVGAEVLSVLEPLTDRLFRTARAEGRREPREAYAADALVEAVCGAKGEAQPRSEASAPVPAPAGSVPPKASAVPAKAIIRIDWDAFVRGFPVGTERCEIAGVGPVPVEVVRAMVASGDVFLAAVVTKGVDVVSVAHLGRRPSAHQLTALQWRDPTCARLGCGATARLEIDHQVDWADSHITLVSLLDRLCRHDHRLKTTQGWALVEGVGKRPLVPPDDPRHPSHAARERPPPAEADTDAA